METLNEKIARHIDKKELGKLEKMSEEIVSLISRAEEAVREIIDNGKKPEKSRIANLLQAQTNSLLIEAGIRKLKKLDE